MPIRIVRQITDQTNIEQGMLAHDLPTAVAAMADTSEHVQNFRRAGQVEKSSRTLMSL